MNITEEEIDTRDTIDTKEAPETIIPSTVDNQIEATNKPTANTSCLVSKLLLWR